MSASEASQQANRAGLDPRRLVVISYLLFGLVLTMFLGRMIGLLFGRVGLSDRDLLPDISTSVVIGFVITLGLAAFAWTNVRVKSLSLEVASELMRVTWPSWEDVRVSTIAVVVASLVAALLLFGMDTLSYKLMVEWLPRLWGSL